MTLISIIVPTLNRDASLERAIASFCLQNFPWDQYEVLVVDNGSRDRTKDVTEAAQVTYPTRHIHYIYEPEPGLLSGRHRGALEAKGEICVFVDDDIEADRNWLQAIKDTFDDPTVQLVGGRNLPKYEADPPEWITWFWHSHAYGQFCCNLSLLDFGDQMREVDANYVWGLNFSIRKTALFELGGFHPDCIPRHLQALQGDGETGLTETAKQRGYKAIYQPQALVFHQVSQARMTYEYFDRRHFFQGVCDSYSQIRRDRGQLKPVSFMEKVKIFLRPPKKAILRLIRHQTDQERLCERFAQNYFKGYQFHQRAVRQNPELSAWILKKDYWDYTLPKLTIKNS